MQKKSYGAIAVFVLLAIMSASIIATETSTEPTRPPATPEQPSATEGATVITGGDINCNTIAFEVADLIMYANFYLYGMGAFEDHIECSIANSDINGDGLALSVADIVLMNRIIVGDTTVVPPPPSPAPESTEPQTER